MTSPLSIDVNPDPVEIRLGGSNPSPDIILLPGSANTSYEFTQVSPSLTWTIVHNLGIYPEVAIRIGGSKALAEVVYDSTIQVTVKFARAQSGTAHLN